ncbi:MAG: sigma-70 family RNA polymerase sigma factor [Thermoanaerobaculia bacterium]|nr:sigma-70 family RNA polymerase sigma factor [Thermoanaerobaculia bacterium]
MVTKEPAEGLQGDISLLLLASRAGDDSASQKLFELVYPNLRQLAVRHLRGARKGPSATSLVHEVFLRLARQDELPFADRVHFFAVVSRAMRQIVIDGARKRNSAKRWGDQVAVDLDPATLSVAAAGSSVEELLALNVALDQLEAEEPRLAQTVEWHFFGGLTFAEIGDATGISERTVLRDWRAARALLHDQLMGADPSP